MTRIRRAGSRWRILVHEYLGRGSETGLPYGHAYHVGSDPRQAEDGTYVTSTTLEGTEFDEVVVGSWLHAEQLDTGKWYLNVGGVFINVTADRDGRPKAVDVYGPSEYAGPVPGCRYSLAWSEDEAADGGAAGVSPET